MRQQGAIEPRAHERQAQQRGRLAREREPLVGARPQQRLLAEPIAREQQRAARSVPAPERPHAAELLQRGGAVEPERFEQHLRVAIGLSATPRDVSAARRSR